MADSVIMDFHKMLLVPALTTAVMYKNRQVAYSTFDQNASYLWSEDHTDEWENSAKVTFECTKLMMSIKIQAIIEQYGFELWETYLEHMMDLTQYFAEQINQKEHWETACHPESNIICYRWTGGVSLEACNQVNAWLRKTIIDRGPFYIIMTNLHGTTYLRSALMNPLTETTDIDELIQFMDQLLQEYQA